MAVTREEITKGFIIPAYLEANLEQLLEKINILRGLYGKPFIINSGYRTPEHNKKIGGAPNSAHLYCQAVDIRDLDKKLATWCLANIDVLEELGLWIENPIVSVNWLHVQTRPAKSRVFKP